MKQFDLQRRNLLSSGLKLGAAGLLLSELSLSSGCQHQNLLAQNRKSAWKRAEELLKNTPQPRFLNQSFNVTSFGAIADAKTSNTTAFSKAIAACHAAGGGKVVIPKGRYATGPIHLKSNVNLHLEEGTELLFSTNPDDYLPAVFTRWEGMEMMGLSPLIYAYGQTNIAVTGKGILNGQANDTTWWPWKGKWKEKKSWNQEQSQQQARNSLGEDTEKAKPVEQRIYAKDSYLRPVFVQFYRCNTTLIEDVTIKNAPFWLIHPVLSQNVTVRGVTCASLGPNSDGCDPESCKNVIIDGCYFDTGDDCIAIKSGRNADGRRLATPSENILIRNCTMRNGHGGVVIGSEISGGAKNIYVENCNMSSPDLDRGLRIKTNSVRGGTIENIYLRKISIGHVQTVFVVDFSYEEGDTGKFTPSVGYIDVDGMTVENAVNVFNVQGYERSPVHNMNLSNIEIKELKDVGVIKNVKDFSTEKVLLKGKPFTL